MKLRARRLVGARAFTLVVLLGVGISACGARSAVPVPRAKLVSSIKAVLVEKYSVSPLVNIECGRGLVNAGEALNCTALSSAGQGYRVEVSLPCWTAKFNGEIIEGAGLIGPPGSPGVPKNTPTGPDNLPDQFSGCLR